MTDPTIPDTMSDLDALIRKRMELHRAADIVANGSRDVLRTALVDVLDECNRCEWGGKWMSPSVVRGMVATKLGITERTNRPPLHPGAAIRNWCEHTGVMRAQVTLRTGLSRKHLSQIIMGKALLSAPVAVLIERATGSYADHAGLDAVTLMELQARWDVAHERANLARERGEDGT